MLIRNPHGSVRGCSGRADRRSSRADDTRPEREEVPADLGDGSPYASISRTRQGTSSSESLPQPGGAPFAAAPEGDDQNSRDGPRFIPDHFRDFTGNFYVPDPIVRKSPTRGSGLKRRTGGGIREAVPEGVLGTPLPSIPECDTWIGGVSTKRVRAAVAPTLAWARRGRTAREGEAVGDAGRPAAFGVVGPRARHMQGPVDGRVPTCGGVEVSGGAIARMLGQRPAVFSRRVGQQVQDHRP